MDKRMNTPYTNANGGQQPFGGVTQIGKDRLFELQKLVAKNRRDRAADIKEIEEKILEQVRKLKNRDEIDANRVKKRKTKTVVMADNDEDTEDEDPDDFNKW